MKGDRTTRCMLAALIALAVYALACVFPAAWSPDSSKVVFPVFVEDRKSKGGPEEQTGVRGLVMVDLAGKVIREVARTDPAKAMLSAASWSPDGKWIAYMTFEQASPAGQGGAPESQPSSRWKTSLVLQQAATGETRPLVSWQSGLPQGEEARLLNERGGAQWQADSKALVVRRPTQDRVDLVLFDLKGKALREVPLTPDSYRTGSFSPDGKHFAYVEKLTGDKVQQIVLCIRNLAGNETREVKYATLERSAEEFHPPLVWSSDSRFLFIPAKEAAEGVKDGCGVLRRYGLETGKTDTPWRRNNCEIAGISLSADTGTLALDYIDNAHEVLGVDVCDPATGKTAPIYYGGTEPYHLSTSISSDGKWVALCPSAQETDTISFVGVIIPVAGGPMRFYLPEPAKAGHVPEICALRLRGALLVGVGGDVKGEEPVTLDVDTVEQAEKVLAVIDGMEHDKALARFPEAAAFGRAFVYAHLLGRGDKVDRDKMTVTARKYLSDFRAAWPDHPAGDYIENMVETALKGKGAT